MEPFLLMGKQVLVKLIRCREQIHGKKEELSQGLFHKFLMSWNPDKTVNSIFMLLLWKFIMKMHMIYWIVGMLNYLWKNETKFSCMRI